MREHIDIDPLAYGYIMVETELSESSTEHQWRLKIGEYFTHGAEEVWGFGPRTKEVHLHRPDRTSRNITR